MSGTLILKAKRNISSVQFSCSVVSDSLRHRNVADSCWCMAKPIQYCKVINLQLNKFILKKKCLILKTNKHKVYTKYQIALCICMCVCIYIYIYIFFFFFTDPGLKRYFLMTNLHLILNIFNEVSYYSILKMAITLSNSSY